MHAAIRAKMRIDKRTLDMTVPMWYTNSCNQGNAGVAELADARDLKSRGRISRTGSIPVSGTTLFPNFISRGGAAR